MGVGCCKYKEEDKKSEIVIPKKIKYNIHEINKLVNKNINNLNIMTNQNDIDVMSNSSRGHGKDRRYDSLDNSPTDNRFQKNTTNSRNPFLGQIVEKGQNEEDQDQDDNINNNRFSGEKNHINNSNIKNNLNFNEFKKMNEINNNVDADLFNKMSNHIIDNESQRKVKGDYNTNNNFYITDDEGENEIEKNNIESNNINTNSDRNNSNPNYNEDEDNNNFRFNSNYTDEEKSNGNNNSFKIETNDLKDSKDENNFNYDSNDNDKLKSGIQNLKVNFNNSINGNNILRQKSVNRENFKGNNKESKNSEDDFDYDKLEAFPIIDNDINDKNSMNTQKENESFYNNNKNNENNGGDNMESYNFNNDYNIDQSNGNNFNEKEIENESLDNKDNQEPKIKLYFKKRVIKLSKNDTLKSEE